MTDEALRRRLLRSYLGELAVMAVVAAAFAYWTWPLFASAFGHGLVTLYPGAPGSAKTPSVLTLATAPYAVAGVLLLYGAGLGWVATLVVRPAYHVLRTGLPAAGLPRVPRAPLRKLATCYLRFLMALAGIGVALIALQAAAINH